MSLKVTVSNLSSVRVKMFPQNSNGSMGEIVGRPEWSVVSGLGSVQQRPSNNGSQGLSRITYLSTPQTNGDTVYSVTANVVIDGVMKAVTGSITLTYGPSNGVVPVESANEDLLGLYFDRGVSGQDTLVLSQANG